MSSNASRHVATTIGANIARGRTTKNRMTQRELGLAIGVDSQQVSKWERGEHRPSAHYEQALADALFGGAVGALYTPIPETKDAA